MRSTRSKPPLTLLFLFAFLAACSPMAPPASSDRGSPFNAHETTSQFRTVFDFHGSNGCNPTSSVVVRRGYLYGTTRCGGHFGNGEVYRLSTSGKIRVIHSFAQDGRFPYGSVLFAGDALYGTTGAGGRHSIGTVYSLDPNGGERWTYAFKGSPDGEIPDSGLVDVNGTLYGTTPRGGSGTKCESSSSGCGTVFKISNAGKESVVYSFQGGQDGSYPAGGLVDVNGTLYGTTSGGGSYYGGTVFSVTTNGEERVIHAFQSCCRDGTSPRGPLIFMRGSLYGTTSEGGYNNLGTVFSLTTSGTERLVYEFGSGQYSNGVAPAAGVLAFQDRLYGTTTQGGTGGFGTVFELTLSGKETVLYSFQDGTDGATPESQLVGFKGVLYGTACAGGGRSSSGSTGCFGAASYGGYGTVFAVTP